MTIVYDDYFDYFEDDKKSRVFQIIKTNFTDSRGSFCEVYKEQPLNNELPEWYRNNSWIKQINQSTTSGVTCRGFHAQRGSSCQGKLVESHFENIIDIIIDARPQSKTFGKINAYFLIPNHNQLWVPRGFFHGMISCNPEYYVMLQYFCDNVYNKESEIGINPHSVLQNFDLTNFPNLMNTNSQETNYVSKHIHGGFLRISDKDNKHDTYENVLNIIKSEYNNGKIWYNN